MTRILDQYGNPILARAALAAPPAEEFAPPTLGGVRSAWSHETVLSGLSPVGMAEILRQAAFGYPDRFFALAEEMEERDMHYRSVLATRRLAITGVEPIVVAGDKDAQSVKIADAVREIVQAPAFADDYLGDLLDALPKGYSLVETIWDRQAKVYHPAEYKWRDQRHFQIDRVDGRTLRMKDGSSRDGVDLPPFAFSVHRPKLKSGLPVRAGLARLAAWAFLFKSFSLKDWMAFLEVYGMPLRVGKFGRGASHDDRRILLQAVRDISTDAAAIIPKEMEIEFLEVKGGTGNGLFGNMSEYLDKQISKGVLGQTMSTDDGASLSQAQVHEAVRHDIARADARQLAITANRDLIRPYVDLNFGPQKRYPVMIIPIVESEDIKVLAEVIDKMVALGMEISMPAMRERMGFEDPEPGDVLLKPVAKASPVVPGAELDDPEPGKKLPGRKPTGKKPAGTGEDDTETARILPVCPHCGGRHELAADERDQLDELVDDALSDWEQDLEPVFEPLKKLFERSRTYEELREGLDDVEAKLDTGPLADKLAKLFMKARGLGDIGER